MVKAVVPLIPNMVFLRATKSDACALANGYGLPLFYMVDRSTGRMLVVPDRQMALSSALSRRSRVLLRLQTSTLWQGSG